LVLATLSSEQQKLNARKRGKRLRALLLILLNG
jgi:hypothetical protein